MAAPHTHHDVTEHPSGVPPIVLTALEALDNIAHIVVAIFFVILAGSVLVYAGLMLLRDMPLIVQPPPSASAPSAASPSGMPTRQAGTEGEAGSLPRPAGAASENAPEGQERSGGSSVRPFLHNSLELLSTLLFVVIVLELLKTIITYLKTHNTQAIMKEFLVVGIISSIRKILLVGAESSLGSTDPAVAYIKEAGGTVITILGILLLIAGLIFLQRTETARSEG